MIKKLQRFGLAGLALGCVSLTQCAAPPPPPVVVTPRPAPDEATIQQLKTAAYNAGFMAGKRLQARHDAAQIAAAHTIAAAAAGTQPPAKPDCPTPPSAASTATVTPLPGTTPAPVYIPIGPAVPLGAAN